MKYLLPLSLLALWMTTTWIEPSIASRSEEVCGSLLDQQEINGSYESSFLFYLRTDDGKDYSLEAMEPSVTSLRAAKKDKTKICATGIISKSWFSDRREMVVDSIRKVALLDSTKENL